MKPLQQSPVSHEELSCSPRSCSAAEAIARVYSAQPSRQSRHAVSVIGKRGEARWVIDPRAAAARDRILATWMPGSFRSKIAWRGVRWAARFGRLQQVPGAYQAAAPLQLGSWIDDLPDLRDCAPVILIGKPSITAKLIVFLCEPSGKIAAVAKLPLTERAKQSILHEAAMLHALPGALPNLPRVLAVNHHAGISFQSWCEGDAIPRTLTASHVDLLLRLPRSGAELRLDSILTSLFDKAPRDLCPPAIRAGNLLPAVVEHGDFVPWNMKRTRDGSLLLLDWEYSASDGLPLIDLCHFFYRQEFLFRDVGPVYRRMHGHPQVQRYCAAMQLAPRTIPALHLVYLLRAMQVEVPDADNGRSHQAFLRQQIAELGRVWATIPMPYAATSGRIKYTAPARLEEPWE